MPEVERVTDQADPHHRLGREHIAVEHAARSGGDAEEGAHRRQDGPEPREGLAAADVAQAQHDQHEAGDRLCVAAPARLRRRAVQPRIGQHAADHQFPEARQRRIERGRAVAVDGRHVEQERHRRHRAEHREHAPLALPGQAQQHGPEDVELLLDGQRPQVQQRLGLGGVVEVAGLAPEGEVRDEARARGHVLAQLFPFVRQQGEPAEGHGGQQHQRQRREDALHAARIELAVAEAVALEAAQDDGGDQEARDDEEDVDADEAALDPLRERVVAEHRQHRDGAQPVDVRAVFRVNQVGVFGEGGRAARGRHRRC
ncbi:hypothetical protein D3C72_1297140 [compost metagenome]